MGRERGICAIGLRRWTPLIMVTKAAENGVARRMSKTKNGGLDQYGAEPFEQQQFGTAGVEGVNSLICQKIKTSRDLDHAHLGAVCHHRAGGTTPVPRGR